MASRQVTTIKFWGTVRGDDSLSALATFAAVNRLGPAGGPGPAPSPAAPRYSHLWNLFVATAALGLPQELSARGKDSAGRAASFLAACEAAGLDYVVSWGSGAGSRGVMTRHEAASGEETTVGGDGRLEFALTLRDLYRAGPTPAAEYAGRLRSLFGESGPLVLAAALPAGAAPPAGAGAAPAADGGSRLWAVPVAFGARQAEVGYAVTGAASAAEAAAGLKRARAAGEGAEPTLWRPTPADPREVRVRELRELSA